MAIAAAPRSQAFELPRTSMFYGSDVWHLVARFRNETALAESSIGELRNLVMTEKIKTPVPFAITKLNGVHANNHDYGDIHEFAFKNFRHDYDGGRAIHFLSERDFQNNIAVFNSDIGQPARVTWCEWSGRYYLMNSGRGHHTAAIYRQCKEQGRGFVFDALLTLERINPNAIRALSPFHLLICEKFTALNIWEWSRDFREGESWLPFDFPRGSGPLHDQRLAIVGIPRDSPLKPAAMRWLARTPDSLFDFSMLLDSYRPAARVPDALLSTPWAKEA